MKKILSFITVTLTSIFLLLSGFIDVKAQTSAEVPPINYTAVFTGPYSSTARTYQLIIDNNMLTALNGKYINSIAFRLPNSSTANWPSSAVTYSSYEIYMSDGVEPVNRALNFASNVVGTQTMVRSGALTVPAGALSGGSNPNNFSFIVNLNTSYLYTAGTNLVIEIRHTGSDGTSTSVHAAGTSSPGYGTDYTACWQGTGNVAQGNFAYVKINAVDNLGVHSVELDPELTVYPNPARDELFVKSAVQFRMAEVLNYAGQTVLRRELQSSQRLDVSQLAAGNYILKLSAREGQSVITKFIKQ